MAESFERKWFMCDYARERVFVRDEFVMWLDALKGLGYNGLGMYLEGAYDFECIPGVIREGVITREDAKWILAEGKKRGIYVFPMTNVVGHMEHFFRQERFSDMMMDGYDMQMDFRREGAEEFVMRIVRELCEAFECRMIHIGGDETRLTEDTKMLYAEFLARICKNLLNEGVQPAIWDDMIWMDPEMCDVFDRRTFIFDWNYYGHRPESIQHFKKLGFSDIIVCPCDNSWENFITHQHLSGHLKAHTDIPVQPDEVEAFLEDARLGGLPHGLLTNWNNETGRNMWAQWTTFARAGLYMDGRLEARERNDTLIETALFGRVTPYTELTYDIQNQIQGDDHYRQWYGPMRSMLFSADAVLRIYGYLRADPAADFFSGYLTTADQLENKLNEWTPEGQFEINCYTAMAATIEMIRAAACITKALDSNKLYRRAADVQFDSPEAAAVMLGRVAGGFRTAAEAVRTAAAVHAEAIKSTGHTKFDLVRMRDISDKLDETAGIVDKYSETCARIPLPRFDMILGQAFGGKMII